MAQMLFFLVLYYLSSQYGTQGMPIPYCIQEQGPSLVKLNRGLFNIVWSCLWTTILCAWVSVHPNVPPKSKLSAFLRRLWIMFWTIIAPELVLAWAVRQRFAARMVQREFHDRGWTEIHGHFLIMGGFTLINGKIDKEPIKPEEPLWFSRNREYETKRRQYDKAYRRYNLGPVSFEDFKKLVDGSEIDFPSISIADIEDRSKGDFLSKTLAVVQTTWFLLQCAARIPQRLALTELELVTLALASLNAVTYFFWWNKPLQVQEPVKLFLKKSRDREADSHCDPRNEVTVGEVVSLIRDSLRSFVDAVWRVFQDPCKGGPVDFIMIMIAIPFTLLASCFFVFAVTSLSLLSILSSNDTSSRSQPHRIPAQVIVRFSLKVATVTHKFFKNSIPEEGENMEGHMHIFILFPLLFVLVMVVILFLVPFVVLIPFFFNSVFNIITTDTIPLGAHHVPSFYAPKTTSDRYSRMLVFAFFGVIFGGLHIIGWFFRFPSPVEHTLWSVTAITITGIPLIVAPIDFLIEQNLSSAWLPKMFLVFVMTILLCIYVPARLCLISQAIALLRHQPPSAFSIVEWANFIPHILS